jgi:hypothetical protein
MNADGRRLTGALLAVVTLLGAAAAIAATPVPSGRWSFVFTDQKGRPDRPIRVFTYRPQQCDTRCPILIVGDGQTTAFPSASDQGRREDRPPGR